MAERDELAEEISRIDMLEGEDGADDFDDYDDPEVEAETESTDDEAQAEESPKAQKPKEDDPLSELNRKIDGLTKALTSERTARQMAEAEARVLKESTQPKQEEPEAPEFDPFADNAAEQVRAMIAQETGAVRKELQSRFLAMSERAAREAHPDYQERVAELQQMAQEEPARAQAILQAAQQSDHPAEYVYQEVTRAKADPISLQQQVAALQEKLAALESGSVPDKPAPTPTLSRSRDAGGRTAKGVSSLDDFLKNHCP